MFRIFSSLAKMDSDSISLGGGSIDLYMFSKYMLYNIEYKKLTSWFWGVNDSFVADSFQMITSLASQSLDSA